ncbi:MAG: hypothetical protein OEZ39_05275 [Gammaproteobacteria bacterium]|nr:hypothetical protein [Gammaproteobacteria bacterium]MDH5651265.1 hypothetical protein [Gammaproteobacteria bacterium]
MKIVKEITGILALTAVLTVFGNFLPGLSTLYNNYALGFFLTLVVVLIFRWLYKAHTTRMAKLPPNIRKKRLKVSREWDQETSDAVFSPSQQDDLRNMTKDSTYYSDD